MTEGQPKIQKQHLQNFGARVVTGGGSDKLDLFIGRASLTMAPHLACVISVYAVERDRIIFEAWRRRSAGGRRPAGTRPTCRNTPSLAATSG
jgi:hypothetical protein